MIERKTGKEIYQEIANLGNQIQRQDIKNKVWLSEESIEKILSDLYQEEGNPYWRLAIKRVKETIKERD